jgi:hypothetical protein
MKRSSRSTASNAPDTFPTSATSANNNSHILSRNSYPARRDEAEEVVGGAVGTASPPRPFAPRPQSSQYSSDENYLRRSGATVSHRRGSDFSDEGADQAFHRYPAGYGRENNGGYAAGGAHFDDDDEEYNRFQGLDLPLYNTGTTFPVSAAMGPGLGGAQPQFASGAVSDPISLQYGQEARRRGGGASSNAQTAYDDQARYPDEKLPLASAASQWNAGYPEDDTGKTLGSKGYEMGPGRGGRRGLPPITIRKPQNWVSFPPRCQRNRTDAC